MTHVRTSAGRAIAQILAGGALFIGASFGLHLLFALFGVFTEQSPIALAIGVPNFLAAVLALFGARFLIGRARGAELGFPVRRAPQLLIGFLSGFLLLTVVMGLLVALGDWKFEGRAQASASSILVTLLGGFFIATAEEIAFRGVLFRAVEEWIGSTAALLVTSAFFGIAHLTNPHSSLFAAIAISIEAGLLLGGAYLISRSLWLPIGVHWAWNFTLGSIYGAKVSGLDLPTVFQGAPAGSPIWNGGEWGPEAGLAAFTVCTVAGVVILIIARRHGEWVPRGRAPVEPQRP